MDVQLLNKVLFVLICLILSVSDYKKLIIPNWIVLPAIAVGIYLTGNWHWALIMFLLGAVYYYFNQWAGGDVKMLAMVGAFLGMEALFVFAIFIVLVNVVKIKRVQLKPLPLAPYLFISSLLFIW